MSIPKRCIQILTIVSLRSLESWAWATLEPPFETRANQQQFRHNLLIRTAAAATEPEVLGGVTEFEEWFTAAPDAFCRPVIRHKAFGNRLRGLTYDSHEINERTTVAAVPREFILKASYSNPDWDLQLAQQLWDECQKGQKSELYGYCALLAQGTPLPLSGSSCPPSTAPNALRQWTVEEKSLLDSSMAGRKLLEMQRAQEEQWRSKYNKARNMSWEQFEWAMEAVHSRAFRGNFGAANELANVASVAAPTMAAIAGWAYLQNNPDPNDLVLFGLALAAAVPAALNVLGDNKGGDAVLLPLIDSANHLESADSSIEYDPLKGTMSLSIGPNCLVKEEEGETQLYVSYGPKTDLELLLNYGFLPEIGHVEERKDLAEAFIRRNP